MIPSHSLRSKFFAEFIGTALLIGIGLSLVIGFWGPGSIVPKLIPFLALRRVVTGFLFGTTGCLITLSPVGKISGAHLNPAVSFAFWLRGKMKTRVALAYMAAQMLGAVAGSLLLYTWGRMGSSLYFAATIPGDKGMAAAFTGELLATSALVIVVLFMVGNQHLRNRTPYAIPPLYASLNWIEAPLSGCSTNPARSFGPALISGQFKGFWIYIIAPLLAAGLVVQLFRYFRRNRYSQIEQARISYHGGRS